MSNSIFPTPGLPGGSRGWPIGKYLRPPKTLIQTPAAESGETRIRLGPYCFWEFKMTFPKLAGTFNDPTSYLAKVVGFFAQMGGPASSWLYDDPQDNTITAPVGFGIGDGSTTQFQLTRPIGDYADIIQNLNGTPTIYVAGMATTAFSRDALGVITFNAAPALNAVLSWSGRYYFRCRFKSDDGLNALEEIATNYWTLKTLQWQSVIQVGS